MQKHFRLYDEKHLVPEPQYRNELYVRNFEEFENVLEIKPDFYVVISKDPFSWLLSYRKWVEKCSWPQVQHHYLMEYNLFYKKWLEFARQSDRIFFVTYRDLIVNHRPVLARLESAMELKPRRFRWLFQPTMNQVPHSNRFDDERRDFYIHQEFLKQYSDEERSQLNQMIDHAMLCELGYADFG